MIKIKTLSVIVITCSMLCFPVVSSAVVITGGPGAKNPGSGTGSPSGNKISRITGFVKGMDNGVLVLEDGSKYDLTGVAVINKTSTKTTPGKTVVEMTFINNTLNQVVIH